MQILTVVLLVSPQLVLRKWSELIPGGEFRCFVKENKLIGKNIPLTHFKSSVFLKLSAACLFKTKPNQPMKNF